MTQVAIAEPLSERMLVGAVLANRNVYDLVAHLIDSGSLFDERHAAIWRAIERLSAAGRPIVFPTVVGELSRCGELELAGSREYLAQLRETYEHVADTAESSARFVAYAAVRRKLRQELARLAIEIETDQRPPTEFVSYADSRLSAALGSRPGEGGAVTLAVAVDEAHSGLQKANESGKALGATTSLRDLDDTLTGMHPGELIVIAGRPGSGKTGITAGMLLGNAARGTTCFFASLEMPRKQIAERLMCAVERLPLEAVRAGTVQAASHRWLSAKKLVEALPIRIDDTAAVTLSHVRAEAMRIKNREGLGLVVIDYIQLMRGDGTEGNRELEIGGITRGLKSLAKELGVPVVALSQLNREVEKRSDKRPMLSDLRESGSIEQDADAVVFVYRPSVYGLQKDKGARYAEFIVGKQRNGPTCTVEASFLHEYATFVDA